MISTNIPISSSISALKAKVDIKTGSTLVTCTCKDYLQDFIVTREGDTSKFFGFGVTHKLAASFIDTERKLDIKKGDTITVGYGDGTNFDYPYPTFYVAEVAREEKSNTITVTAFDILYKTDGFTIRELGSISGFELRQVIQIASMSLYNGLRNDAYKIIGEYSSIPGDYDWINDPFNSYYMEDPNASKDEPLRVLLNALAEATHSIYYIDNQGNLTFRRLDKDGEPVLVVNKSMYYELTTQTPRILTNICSATELGDNIYAGDSTGVTQYVRDNPYWTLDTNLNRKLEYAVGKLAGLTITQLECDWEGNHCLEIGDKVAFETENGELVNCFILDDVVDYQGYINEITAWEFTQEDSEDAANPTTIGEKINQTFARVDKVNKRIDLVASDVSANKSQLAEIKLTTDDITLRVESLEQGEIEIDVDLENDANFIALKERVGALEISDTQINASISSVETTLAKDIDDSIADLESSLQGEIQAGDQVLNSEIIAVKERVGALEISDTEIKASVSSVESTLTTKINTDVGNLETSLKEEIKAGDDALSGDIVAITERVSALEITDTEIKASVSNVETTITTVESNLTTKIDTAVSDLETDISDVETSLQEEIEAGDSALSTEITTVKSNVSALEVRAGEINATVKSLETTTNNALDAMNYEVDELAKEVSLKVDSEAVSIVVGQVLSEGVDKVVTASKHYTFDDNGLEIKSSDSEIKTLITENGMRIYKNSSEVLTADNKGVQATDLHARTFLIIGENSRLEDKDNRTACFWIGPAGG